MAMFLYLLVVWALCFALMWTGWPVWAFFLGLLLVAAISKES